MDRDVNPTEIDHHRSLASSLQQMKEMEDKVTEQEKKHLRTKYGTRETPNPILQLGVNVYQ